MPYEPVSTLPAGVPTSRTRLAKLTGGATRLAVLRELEEGATPFWPEPSSPNVLTLKEVTELEGKKHAVFDYVHGVTLREVVEALEEREVEVPLGFVGRVVVDAARAVAGITPARAHGGISDASLLIGFDGIVRVMDFGAPRESRFKAPGKTAFTSDVFSLGAVLHSALSEFGGSYASAVLDGVRLPNVSQLHEEATPALDDVLQRALSRAVDNRQPDTEQLADELQAVLGDEQLFDTERVSQLVKSLFGAGTISDLSPLAPQRRGEEQGEGARSEGLPPPVPDADPGRSLGVDDEQEAPTGSHPLFQPRTPLPDDDAAPQLGPRDSMDIPVPLGGPAETAQDEEPAPTSLIGVEAPMAAIPTTTQPDATNPRVDLEQLARERVSVKEERVAPDVVDTNPTLSSIPADTQPSLRPSTRNTTSHERKKARGQERIPTPPVGIEAASEEELPPALGDDFENAPTGVKKRPVKPPPVEEEQEEEPLEQQGTRRNVKPVSARPIIAGLLVVLVVFIGVGALLKPEKFHALRVKLGLAKPPPEPEPQPLAEEPDAGEAEDAGAAVVAAAEVDAGDDDDELDGGEDEPDEDAGVVDAGVVIDAGKPAVVKKPVKKVVKKKKRRR